MGVDLFDLARCREAAANGVLLTSWGPRLPLEHEATSVEAQAYHMVKAMDEVRVAVNSGRFGPLRSGRASPVLASLSTFDGIKNWQPSIGGILPHTCLLLLNYHVSLPMR